jgi:hydroxypyruvate reductase/glycerate 2-kinase
MPDKLIETFCRLEDDTLVIGSDRYDLTRYRRIVLCGSGKAAWPMAKSLQQLLPGRIDTGVLAVSEDKGNLAPVEVMEGSHPVPDEKSLRAGTALLACIESCGESDLLIYLLSGGSSALTEVPDGSITMAEFQETTRLLLKHDIPIGSINTVRKHLSRIKGGRLGGCCKADAAVLVISDVVGDGLDVIGSAPMYCDHSTYGDAKALCENTGIFNALPASVQEVLNDGCKGLIPESPKAVPPHIRHYIIGRNQTALQAAKVEAETLGYRVEVAEKPLVGDADLKGPELLTNARKSTADQPLCTLIGGETTVILRGEGKGGRNQQLCLSALHAMYEDDTFTLLCAGTDGIDGNSSAAGAIIDAETLEKAENLKLSAAGYLLQNDANSFFKQTGDLIETGPTGTNVMDVTILIRNGN